MKTNLFHNTTNINGLDLERAINIAKNQNEKVLAVFKLYGFTTLTPWVVMDILNRSGHTILITSVRRSMNTLEDEGWIIRTDNKVKERHGAINYTWRLRG